MEEIPENKFEDKKIVFFVPETIPSPAGGGRNAFYFARYLNTHRAKSTIACLNYNNKLPHFENIEGVKIYRFNYFNRSVLHKILSIPFLVINYFKTITQAEIIFLYGYYLPASIFILLISKLLNKKIIYRSSLLGDDDIQAIKKKSGISWSFKYPLFAGIDLYFAINQKFEEKWQMVFRDRVKVLTSLQGVDPTKFNHNGRLHKISAKSNSKFTILSCGIICERKGYRQIFDALKKLDIEFKYIVIGSYNSSPYHKSSRSEFAEMKQIYKLGKELLGDKIEFIDNSENMAEYYHTADIFLHAAISEGTPNVVIEAMACGMPVLLKELDGLSEILINGFNADIFQHYSQLAERLQFLMENPEYRKTIGANAATTIENEFTFNHLADKLIEKLYGA